MIIRRAMQIVLDLAEQNVIEEKEVQDEDMEASRAEQLKAVAKFREYVETAGEHPKWFDEPDDETPATATLSDAGLETLALALEAGQD